LKLGSVRRHKSEDHKNPATTPKITGQSVEFPSNARLLGVCSLPVAHDNCTMKEACLCKNIHRYKSIGVNYGGIKATILDATFLAKTHCDKPPYLHIK
jgi:hypothetical protein